MNFFKKLFRKANPEPVQTDELDGTRGDLIMTFKSMIRQRISQKLLHDTDFAMWIPSEGDEFFAESPVRELWTEIYEELRRYHSYIAADLLKALELIEDPELFQMELPEDMLAFGFETTEGEQVILSLSKSKGIRLHFAATTPLAYRTTFLMHFLQYCRAWKELANISGGQADEPMEFENWWHSASRTAMETEQLEQLHFVGRILL